MVQTKDEFLAGLRDILGENTDDKSLQILENAKDTFEDFENKTNDTTNWKEKYEQNDKEWRDRYRDRFFSNKETVDKEFTIEEPETKEPLKFENLFN